MSISEIKRNTVIELQYLQPGDRFYLTGSVKHEVWSYDKKIHGSGKIQITSDFGKTKQVKEGKSVVFLRSKGDEER